MASGALNELAVKLGAEVMVDRKTATLAVPADKVSEACLGIASLPDLYHLSTITGYDDGEKIVILYQFWRGRIFVVVRTSVPREAPRLQSISGQLPSATLYEAEIQDLLGVEFVGSPYAGKRLLLSDDYPKDAPPPLRKDADPERIRKMMKLE
jgi:membrane-bound hydrogenase subunit beta